MERLVTEIQELLDREAEELMVPLSGLAMTLRGAGHLDDAYTVICV